MIGAEHRETRDLLRSRRRINQNQRERLTGGCGNLGVHKPRVFLHRAQPPCRRVDPSRGVRRELVVVCGRHPRTAPAIETRSAAAE
jgi:hypothetical protein